MGVNKVILVGNVGQAPEMRFTPTGDAVANFRVAVSRRYNNSSGETIEETEWFTVIVWRKLAELCNQYLEKGRLVYVEGRGQTRTWQDKNGAIRTKFEVQANVVQFLGRGASDVATEDMKVVEQLGEIGVEVEVESVKPAKEVAKPALPRPNRKVVKKK
uniref:Putative single-stranded DNA-binding protein n=1 Tax=viral metagenome TaxID=1070528 RepID=A0A6H2A535_9ZZZZ